MYIYIHPTGTLPRLTHRQSTYTSNSMLIRHSRLLFNICLTCCRFALQLPAYVFVLHVFVWVCVCCYNVSQLLMYILPVRQSVTHSLLMSIRPYVLCCIRNAVFVGLILVSLLHCPFFIFPCFVCVCPPAFLVPSPYWPHPLFCMVVTFLSYSTWHEFFLSSVGRSVVFFRCLSPCLCFSSHLTVCSLFLIRYCVPHYLSCVIPLWQLVCPVWVLFCSVCLSLSCWWQTGIYSCNSVCLSCFSCR